MTYHWIGRETDELREFDLRKLREAIQAHKRTNPESWLGDVWGTTEGVKHDPQK